MKEIEREREREGRREGMRWRERKKNLFAPAVNSCSLLRKG